LTPIHGVINGQSGIVFSVVKVLSYNEVKAQEAGAAAPS